MKHRNEYKFEVKMPKRQFDQLSLCFAGQSLVFKYYYNSETLKN